MKKLTIILAVVLALLIVVFCFWDPIIDFLPIDQSRWVERDGGRYLLDEDGDPRTGWVETEDGRFYLGHDGVMRTGWLEEGGNRYYLDATGRMHTGWLEENGARFWFGENGVLGTGLLEEDGKVYYLDDSGSPVSGFYPVEGTLCYMDSTGIVNTGWLHLDESSYYLDAGAVVHTGWLDEGGSRYYFAETDGAMVTGWLDLPEGSFYLHTDGTLATGWTEIDGTVYCFDENGNRYSGWLERDGKRYCFDEDGALASGWIELDGNRYYILPDGTPAVGKLEIDGEPCFFSSTGINFIMVNPWHDLPEGFEVELVKAENARMDPVCQEALTQMLSDCREAGFSPIVRSSYRSIADQRANLRRMVQSYQDRGYGYNQAYAAATQIVAVPGTSEHHLGLAFDIVDSAYTNLNHQQAKRPTQQWLMEHCWEYGFILRYPENTTEITGIIWEPWHYRYVGVEMALEIRDLGCITLEEYIDNLTANGTTCGGKVPTDE